MSKAETLCVSPYTTRLLEIMTFPNYCKPVELGSFSCDDERRYYGDARMLQKIVMPKDEAEVVKHFNLSEGYERFVKRDEMDKEYIDSILMWIMENENKLMEKLPDSQNKQECDQKPRINVDFVCWRGLLTKLLCTSYENMDGWIIAVTRMNGTYYMCEFPTDKKISDILHSSDRQKLMSYWGYRFEHYLTSGCRGRDEVVVNNNVAYCGIFRTKLNEHTILLSGEIDGVDRDSGEYIELKTSRLVETPQGRQDRNMKRYKMIKWWAQCFTPNVPTIVCGYRDDNGNVVKLEKLRTREIPKLCELTLGSSCWKSTACMNFLDHFLSYVKAKVTTDSESDVHVFEWSPNGSQQVSYTKHTNDPSWTFLPEWFIARASAEASGSNMSGCIAGGSRSTSHPCR